MMFENLKGKSDQNLTQYSLLSPYLIKMEYAEIAKKLAKLEFIIFMGQDFMAKSKLLKVLNQFRVWFWSNCTFILPHFFHFAMV